MSPQQTPEQLITEALAAPEQREAALRAIPEKALLYGAPYFLALVGCTVLLFYAGWFRWVAGLLIALCLVTAWSMRGAFVELRRASIAAGFGVGVLPSHRLLNALALLLLAYALLAVWGGWPFPVLAVLIAFAINLVHYAGFRTYAARG